MNFLIYYFLILAEFCRAGLPRTKSKVLHIGATFPISGKEGWQGGQVSLSVYIKHFCIATNKPPQYNFQF